MMTNRYAGVCDVCQAEVTPLAGWLATVDGAKSVLCGVCGPKKEAPRVRIWKSSDGKIRVKPATFLGGDLFASYRSATAGCRFDRDSKDNVADARHLGEVIKSLSEAGFRIDASPEIAEVASQDDARVRRETEAAESRAQAIDQILSTSGKSLMPFQRDGVKFLAPRPGAILADDMGLGKTIQALAAAPKEGGVLIVCPKVAKGVWQREAARWRPDLRVSVLSGRGSFRWPATSEMVVVNYDVLPKEEEWEEKFANAPACTLVADEAHMLKGNAKVGRVATFRKMSDLVRQAGGRAWMLTGTPLLNRPDEVWNLLRCAGMEKIVFGDYERFLNLCGGSRGRYGVVWGAAIDESVPSLLTRAVLRRMKRDVLKQLPAKIVDVVDVELDDLGKAGAAELEVAGAFVRSAVSDAARDAMRSSRTAVSFKSLSRAREILAKAKIGAAMEMAAELEEAGEPVLILSAHKAVAEAFSSRGYGIITGDTSDEERSRIADRFQAGELRGIAGTIQAMGVAITLTRGAHAVVVDPVWTPGLNQQAEDRLNRIGQERTVHISYLRANHPVDRLVFDVCEIKANLVAETVDKSPSSRHEATLASSALASAPVAEGEEFDEEALLEELRQILAMRDSARSKKRLRKTCSEKAAKAVETRRIRLRAPNPATAVDDSEPRSPHGAVELWAERAIRTLAGACDGAVTEDGAGFSKTDVAIGHAFAASIDSGIGLTSVEWQVAAHICMTYPRQVGRPGDGELTKLEQEEQE